MVGEKVELTALDWKASLSLRAVIVIKACSIGRPVADALGSIEKCMCPTIGLWGMTLTLSECPPAFPW